jgi:type IV secretion system protein VirB4
MIFADLLKRKSTLSSEIPSFNTHVSDSIISMVKEDKLLMALRLDGIPFELEENYELESKFDGFNQILSAIGKSYAPNVAIWTHFIRSKSVFNKSYNFESEFVNQFSKKYLRRFDKEEYFDNEFYITVLLKYEHLDDAIHAMNDITMSLQKSFEKYTPHILSIYEENEVMYSELYEFLAFLLNGKKSPQPLLEEPAHITIPNCELFFGHDLFEQRNHEGNSRYGVCYDLRSFPEHSYLSMFDKLLIEEKSEFVLTQSFLFIPLAVAQKKVDEQLNKLRSINDQAADQQIDLEEAKGFIASGNLMLGEYHGALVVYGDTPQEAKERGSSVVASFVSAPASWSKACQSAPITYLSQMPGHKLKPRPSPKSSRSLAAAFNMHTFSTGKKTGNPIGDGEAIIPLQTRSKNIYHFNFHYSKDKQDNIGEKIPGHTLILGMTGTGKTTTQLTLLSFLERYNPKIFAVDKDRGMEIFIRALGGSYFPLKAGEPTGLAPFQLEDTAKNREFLYELVGACGKTQDGKITDQEKIQVKVAVDTVMGLPHEQRVFSRILESIPHDGEDCLAVRLAKWCHSHDGRFAWALDNPSNHFDPANFFKIGFDVTDFLKDHYEPTEPVLAYLFHLKDLMQQNGGLLATVVEEFWLPCKYEITRRQIEDVLKTGRKRDEFIILVSQSPEDAIHSVIFPTIRDQTVTKIFLPNPAADYDSYKKCHLNEKEFTELKKLTDTSRTFLIKQGNQSCFAVLDLYGFDDELAIISGSSSNIAILDEVIAEVGHNPDVWIPLFHQRRKEGSKK